MTFQDNSGFLHSRTNLSPFTKDFRGEGQIDEYLTYFSLPPSGGNFTKTKMSFNLMLLRFYALWHIKAHLFHILLILYLGLKSKIKFFRPYFISVLVDELELSNSV